MPQLGRDFLAKINLELAVNRAELPAMRQSQQTVNVVSCIAINMTVGDFEHDVFRHIQTYA